MYKKQILLIVTLFSALSSASIANPYYFDGTDKKDNDKNTGNISISQSSSQSNSESRPISSARHQFTYFREIVDNKGKVLPANALVLRNATTGIVNIPDWDLYLVGDNTLGGTVTARVVSIGFEGELRN